MHELPVISSILKIVEKHAADHQVKKVVAIHLQVGELSDLEDKWMQQYFDSLSKNSIARGAKLKIERIPVIMRCNNCGMSFSISVSDDSPSACPGCQSEKQTLVSGREYYIKHLEAI